ncbi:MAG TPA: hypothetical protein VHK27_04070 [Gammaproteobacteria bacterium]|nr:hypothetical protein [Gammaproteobacteria bacterium]
MPEETEEFPQTNAVVMLPDGSFDIWEDVRVVEHYNNRTLTISRRIQPSQYLHRIVTLAIYNADEWRRYYNTNYPPKGVTFDEEPNEE